MVYIHIHTTCILYYATYLHIHTYIYRYIYKHTCNCTCLLGSNIHSLIIGINIGKSVDICLLHRIAMFLIKTSIFTFIRQSSEVVKVVIKMVYMIRIAYGEIYNAI